MNAKLLQVLLIESNPVVACLVLGYLKDGELPTTSYWVQSLSEGIDVFEKGRFDVILLTSDLLISEGLDKLLRIIRLNPAITLILLTGQDEARVASLVPQGEIDDYLPKDKITKFSLYRAIQHALERRQFRQELMEKDQELESIMRNLHNLITVLVDGVLVVDADRNIKYANPPAQDLLGLQFDALKDNPFPFQIKCGIIDEVKISRKQLPSCYVEVQATPFLWEGKNAHLISLRDITVQQLMMTGFLQSDRRARGQRGVPHRSPNSRNIILLGLDMQCNITFINKRGREMLGYDQKDLLGKRWPGKFRSPRHCPDEDGERIYHEFCESAILTRQGEERLFAWHNTSLKDEEGKPIGILSVGEDITGSNYAGASRERGEDKGG